MDEPIKKKIELEVEVTPNNIGANPYHKWIHLAKTVDAWRIFPRFFFGTYIVLLLKSVIWFMALVAPTPAQAGLISIMTGVGAAWFSSYVNSGWNGRRAIIARAKNE